jgi:enoyl-CoA hydratase/carnithine racemase
MPERPLVTYRCQDRIAHIQLARPEKLNAVNDPLADQFAEALQRFDADESAWIAILSGEGRAFSTGADVRERQLRDRSARAKEGGPLGRSIHPFDLFTKTVNWKPIIAAPHGYVLGMGLAFAFLSDLVVTEANTQFQVTETSRGLPGARYYALLRHRGGGSLVDELVLTGRYFTGAEAFRAGIVNDAVEGPGYYDRAVELAEQVVRNPPLSVRASVRWRRLQLEDLARDAKLVTDPLRLHLTSDFRKSAEAWVTGAKTPPEYEAK